MKKSLLTLKAIENGIKIYKALSIPYGRPITPKRKRRRKKRRN